MPPPLLHAESPSTKIKNNFFIKPPAYCSAYDIVIRGVKISFFLYQDGIAGLNWGMDKMPLNLMDLVPKETEFTLSSDPAKKITLCRWSLRVRAWAIAKYTSQGLKEIFEQHKIDEIADMAFFMLKDKELFKSKDDFLDAIVTIQDQVDLIKALLGAVGIGEPEFKKIDEAMAKAGGAPGPLAKSPKKKIGAKSSTR